MSPAEITATSCKTQLWRSELDDTKSLNALLPKSHSQYSSPAWNPRYPDAGAEPANMRIAEPGFQTRPSQGGMALHLARLEDRAGDRWPCPR